MLKYLFLLSILFENIFGMDEYVSSMINDKVTEYRFSAHAVRGLYNSRVAQECHLPVELISRPITGDELFGAPALSAKNSQKKHLFKPHDPLNILKSMKTKDVLENCHHDFKVAIRSDRKVFFGWQMQAICHKSSDYEAICMNEYILRSQPSYYKCSSL